VPDADVNPAELWHKVIQEVEKTPGKHQLKIYMQELKPVSFRDGVLQVAYDEDVPEEHQHLLLEPDSMTVLQKCFRRVSPVPNGRLLLKRWIESVSRDERTPRFESSPEIKERVGANPFVRRVCELFDATVVDVRG